MSLLKRAQQFRSERESTFAKDEPTIRGVLVAVDYPDSANVATQSGYVWAQLYGQPDSSPVPVFNRTVPALPNLRVLVRRAPKQSYYEVLNWDAAETITRQDDYSSPAIMQSHAREHEIGGYDPLFIYLRAMTMLRCSPLGGGFLVSVPPTNYPTGQGTLARFPGQNNFDLSSFQPASGFACLVLVYLDTETNTLDAVAGADAPDSPTFVPEKPAIPEGAIPSAYVRLSGDATELSEGDIFEDTRAFVNPLVHDALRIRTIRVEDGAPNNGDRLAYSSGSGEIEWTPLPIASETVPGIIEIATQAEVDAGTDTGRAVTPATLTGNPRFLPCNGRLTLTTGTPVTTSDVMAATTIYFSPFGGNRISLYTGSIWKNYAFTEKSLSLSGFTANKNSDVFIHDNSGTLTLERVEWTNDTTRATALTTQDGVLVKSGDTTRRYLGTFRTTGTTGQCEDSVTKRYVWNYYNRRRKYLTIFNGSSNTYDSTWRPFNNDQPNSDVELVTGVVEHVIDFSVNASMTFVAGGSAAQIGIGLNSTTSPVAFGTLGLAGTLKLDYAQWRTFPTLGYNYIVILQQGGNTGADPTFNNATLSAAGMC